MMELHWTEKCLFILVALGTLIGALCIGFSIATDDLEKQAISHGAAQYNPTNGNFEWKK